MSDKSHFSDLRDWMNRLNSETWQPPSNEIIEDISIRARNTIIHSWRIGIITWWAFMVLSVGEIYTIILLALTFPFIYCVGVNVKVYERITSPEGEDFFRKILKVIETWWMKTESALQTLFTEECMRGGDYMSDLIRWVTQIRDTALDWKWIERLPIGITDIFLNMKYQTLRALWEAIFPFKNLIQTLRHTEELWVKIHDNSAILQILENPSLWMWESYMQWKWDHPDIFRLYYDLLSRDDHASISSIILNNIFRIRSMVENLQDRVRSKQVIEQHYDEPPEVYEQFLDPYMQYTCWLYSTWDISDNEWYKQVDTTMSLEESQIQKMERICQKLDLQPGETLLDIGGGWWWLAKYAAETRWVKVEIVTLSGVQADYAEKMCHGLNVKVHRCDYRDMLELLEWRQFDKIACVWMLEHVGHKNIDNFFDILSQSFKPGWKWLLHSMFSPKNTYMRDPFVEKYTFSGGEIISWKTIWENLSKYVDLELWEDWWIEDWTPHYVQTLSDWNKRYQKIEWLSPSDMRKQSVYMNSMAAGFATKRMCVGQWAFSKPLEEERVLQ